MTRTRAGHHLCWSRAAVQISEAERLSEAGTLLQLVVPKLSIQGKGRPSHSQPKGEQERVLTVTRTLTVILTVTLTLARNA